MVEADAPGAYDIREQLPSPETFARLREAAKMAARSPEGIERASHSRCTE